MRLKACAVFSVLVWTWFAASAYAQEIVSDTVTVRPPRYVTLEIGGGMSMSIGPEQTVPPDAREQRIGLSTTGRILWRPGHLLGIGLHSGYVRISSMRTAAYEEPLFLSVVPAMVAFAMKYHDLELSVATGWYRYIVSTNTRGISSAWEMGYRASAAYTPLHIGALGIGVEASYASLPERTIGAGSVQVRLSYELVEY